VDTNSFWRIFITDNSLTILAEDPIYLVAYSSESHTTIDIDFAAGKNMDRQRISTNLNSIIYYVNRLFLNQKYQILSTQLPQQYCQVCTCF
jgi:hypothetical protein